ncbi:hypothetical protein V5G65_12715 [Mammaliicoccus sciuri]
MSSKSNNKKQTNNVNVHQVKGIYRNQETGKLNIKPIKPPQPPKKN